MKASTKKVATNIPADLLKEASKLTGLNQTATLVRGLEEIIKKEKVKRFLELRGKIKIDFDPNISRGRVKL
jgi:hypothetical protein